MPKLRMRQAVVQALDDEMTEDASVILLGEDIAVAGGSFKATEGLLEKFGPSRRGTRRSRRWASSGRRWGPPCRGSGRSSR